jgi:hypothetical protein
MQAAIEAWKVDVATGATKQPEPPKGAPSARRNK